MLPFQQVARLCDYIRVCTRVYFWQSYKVLSQDELLIEMTFKQNLGQDLTLFIGKCLDHEQWALNDR